MILVVDDDKNIRLSLKLILERNEYEVALAVQGMRAGAFDFINNQGDYTMPCNPPDCLLYYLSVEFQNLTRLQFRRLLQVVQLHNGIDSRATLAGDRVERLTLANLVEARLLLIAGCGSC